MYNPFFFGSRRSDCRLSHHRSFALRTNCLYRVDNSHFQQCISGYISLSIVPHISPIHSKPPRRPLPPSVLAPISSTPNLRPLGAYSPSPYYINQSVQSRPFHNMRISTSI
ncbi:hypothetical protein GQ43DRAFT_242855 [Delitschia confertaspora ATCC 74209]|uniref:Uncharacterized protein n=1 Tax=Delitschia confertaspora ATCC 74209 TaxID=1513339 RepID=A0A9P4JCM3_9PLEO|nr:hypothetical protein GQ43DRAFT_242855 [Delitschia confertaspora ATCC 74209]